MKFFRVLRAVLREVFEEAAYERFCAREKTEVSRDSYAVFLRETDQAKQHKVRCC
jgi:hypothetical protein